MRWAIEISDLFSCFMPNQSLWSDVSQISRLMQMKCESDKKEKELFEENKAANLRMQSKHEDFTKLSVNFEHFRGESQNLKAERDKLLQDIEKMSQSEATLQKEFKVQTEEIQTRQVKCGCT